MSDDSMKTIPTLSVEKTVEQLSESFSAVISSGISPNVLPSVMLWGPPGVGKSQAVRQIADRIKAKTGKKTVVTDVRLLLFNPIDLRGIPTADENKTEAIWLRPQIFRMDASRNTVNLLFLDEISAAPPSVQAAAYQIALDHTVGEHKLPDNCIVIAAGNRVTDKSVAYKMPKALANRLCHIEMESNFESWRKWAVGGGIHEKIIGFLSARNDLLMGFDASREDLAFPTPRSWEMVSRLLNATGIAPEKLHPLIAGCVGTGVAAEFRTWCRIYASIPRTEDIFAGKRVPVPKETDALYALISSMTVYAREHKNDLNAIANSIVYALAMPSDYSAVLFKNYLAIEDDYRMKLLKIPEFKEWVRTKGRLLNGAF